MDKRLRLAVVTAFPPGGNSLSEFGYHFVRNLARNREVGSVVVIADRTHRGSPMVPDGLDDIVESVPTWRFNSWTSGSRIVRELRRADVDAVIFNLQFATFGDRRIAGGLGLLSPWMARLAGFPTGVILHNLVENVDLEDAGFAGNALAARAMAFAGRLLTRALLRADYVALTIPRYVELLRESYGTERALLTPHGSFDELVEPHFGHRPDEPRRILAFGKWGTYKTVDVLIDAYRLLRERGFDDVELVIAGTDSPNSPGYLAEVAAGCADGPPVTFTGYVDEDDVPELFASATTTAFPYTSTTGSSGVLHQAGSYGRSAVLPAIGDFVELIEEEGFVGRYFEPGHAVSLADALAKLLDDQVLNAEHGRRNFLAAAGVAMVDVVDWHVIHIERLMSKR